MNDTNKTASKKAYKDLQLGFARSSYWFAVAWQEIKQRYRRSMLGPFWITLSTGVMIGAMGPLYGKLFDVDVTTYFQYLSVSMVFWIFLSSCVNEACTVFISSEGYIKQVSLPFSGYVLKLLYKNILFLAHNFVIVAIVLFFLPPKEFSQIWLFPIALLIVFFNLFFFSLTLGLVCTRFRDVPQLIANIMQVMFFLSPIMWKPEMLGEKGQHFVQLNPIYHLIEILRSSLIGGVADHVVSFIVSLALLVIGAVVSLLIFSKYRARIPYWL